MITFEAISDINRELALSLHVAVQQSAMIETVEQSLEEASLYPCWNPVIIRHHESAIGFAMYGMWTDPDEPERVWLDRFFIDIRFQGNGYAKLALTELISYIYHQFSVNELYLSVYEDNYIAIQIYQSLGFVFNGELDINGEKVMILKRS